MDGLGWEWIFFINVPVGVCRLRAGQRLVPSLSTHPHKFDCLGVALSAVGLFLLVFGIQEGHHYDWGTIAGPISVWGLIITGLVVLGLFVFWQALNRRAAAAAGPVPRPQLLAGQHRDLHGRLHGDVDGLPADLLRPGLVRGLTPTQSALLLVPMAVVSVVLAPSSASSPTGCTRAGLTGFGFAFIAASLLWLSPVMTPDSATWEILLPMALLGFGMAGVWAPLAATATRNLPLRMAGAGAGVYNATRQSGPCSARRRSRCSWTAAWPPRD